MLDIYSIKQDKIVKDLVNSKTFSYIRCIKPSEKEIAFLVKKLNIDKNEFIDFLGEEERPRLEKESCLQITYDTPHIEKGEVSAIPFKIFIKNNLLVTLENGNVKIINDIIRNLNSGKSKYLLKRPGDFLFKLLDRINDDFLNHVNTIEGITGIMKNKSFDTDNKWIKKVYDASVTLSFFHQSLIANSEVLNSLRKIFFRAFTKTDLENFSDLYYDSLNVMDNAKIQREVLLSLFNLQTAISQSKLNNFMNRITIIAVIIAVPTMISGIYGMNFKIMPLAENPFGFWIMLLLMSLITLILLYFFRKVDIK